ncbi:MAG TPA: thioredoxin family protein [Verrucomicrobiae bacterium]|nr:thioredoxin family protein [Verrucomicrobiae bacterium]
MSERTRRAVCALVIGIALAAAPRPARASWYDDAAGYEYALRRQRSDQVPVLVYFRTDWCPHCRALDGLLDSPEVRSRLNDYLKVRINPEHGAAERRLFEQEYGSRGYPALFLRANGRSAVRLSTAGPPARFLAQLPR